jgi:hypothetical protein
MYKIYFFFRRGPSFSETDAMPFYFDGITLVLADVFILIISENMYSLFV